MPGILRCLILQPLTFARSNKDPAVAPPRHSVHLQFRPDEAGANNGQRQKVGNLNTSRVGVRSVSSAPPTHILVSDGQHSTSLEVQELHVDGVIQLCWLL